MIAFFALFAAAAAAHPGPESVLVIRNENSALSRTIVEYYCRRRGIPQGNICSIRTSSEETVNREVYTREIETPIGACLTSRGLTEKILYIVTTAQVPLRVQGSMGLDGDNASVDSELTLLYAKLHGARLQTKGIVPSPFFNRKDAAFTHPQFPIYLVTRLAAYDFNGVRAIIDRALAAKNRGTVVLDATSSDDKDGDRWLRDAAIRIPTERTVFDDTSKVLYDQKNVIAYAAWGSNDHNRTRRRLGFQWLPGAIVTEFVSTNGRTFARPPQSWTISNDWKRPEGLFASSPQSLVTDYLDEGATGMAGHVDEPYLQLTPRPELLIPAYLSGRNLAESFYLAIPGLSWQNIVVGDPLCSLGASSK